MGALLAGVGLKIAAWVPQETPVLVRRAERGATGVYVPPIAAFAEGQTVTILHQAYRVDAICAEEMRISITPGARAVYSAISILPSVVTSTKCV